MLERGQFLELNRSFDGLISVSGRYPSGQMNYAEDHYKVMIEGREIVIPESIVMVIFQIAKKEEPPIMGKDIKVAAPDPAPVVAPAREPESKPEKAQKAKASTAKRKRKAAK